jgi:hypothetical protein
LLWGDVYIYCFCFYTVIFMVPVREGKSIIYIKKLKTNRINYFVLGTLFSEIYIFFRYFYWSLLTKVVLSLWITSYKDSILKHWDTFLWQLLKCCCLNICSSFKFIENITSIDLKNCFPRKNSSLIQQIIKGLSV